MHAVGCVKAAHRTGRGSRSSEAGRHLDPHGASSRSRPAIRRLGALAAGAVTLLVAGVPAGWSLPASAAANATSFHAGTAFSDVSCASTTSCTAVGSVGSLQPALASYPEPIYATEVAGVWSKAIEVPAPEQGGVFTAVSCPTSTSCTAVGYDYSAASSAPLVGYPIYATESKGRWSHATEVTSSVGGSFLSASGAAFTSVSCTAVGDCTAVGGNGPMYATESDGRWGPATFLDTETFVGSFNAVSCTAATDCTAVGDDESYNGNYGYFSVNEPIHATESAGTWSAPSEDVAPGAGTGSFDGVSCTTASSCTAVGAAANTPIGATETAGTWSATTEVTVPGTDGSLTAVSCTGATDCTAVGSSLNPAFGTVSSESIHVTESGGAWGTADASGGGAFAGLSCPSTAGCTVVGALAVCGLDVNFCTGPNGEYPIYSAEGAGAWRTVPLAPRLERVTASNRAIKVDWAPSSSRGGPVVAGYTAVADVRNHTIVRAFSCEARRTSCTIRGVTNGKTYSVSVYAHSAAGSSVTSSKMRAVPTREARTLVAPSQVVH